MPDKNLVHVISMILVCLFVCLLVVGALISDSWFFFVAIYFDQLDEIKRKYKRRDDDDDDFVSVRQREICDLSESRLNRKSINYYARMRHKKIFRTRKELQKRLRERERIEREIMIINFARIER